MNKRWLQKQNKKMVADFRKLEIDPSLTLTSISKKYGFSKEYARQLFEKIYGYKFTILKDKRIGEREAKEQQERFNKKNPINKVNRYVTTSNAGKGAQSEKLVLDICLFLGYEYKPFPRKNQIDLVINNFWVDVKSRYKGFLLPKIQIQRYQFQLTPFQYKHANFIICHIVPTNKFFIIPKKSFPKSRMIYITDSPKIEWHIGNHKIARKNKYWKFLEAWDLLKNNI